jgi:hypothetical protein
MRLVRTLFMILPCFLAIAAADTLPPSLVWTGDPTSYGGIANATDTGMAISDSCLPGPNCFSSDAWTRTFTVTSPGTFVLSGSVTENAGASNCDPFACSPSASISNTFTLLTSVMFASGGLDLSGSGSATSPTGCGTQCGAFINLSDAESVDVNLGIGNYTLLGDYNESTNSTGDMYVELQGDLNLVPTPEPREAVVLLVLPFVTLLWRRRYRGR